MKTSEVNIFGWIRLREAWSLVSQSVFIIICRHGPCKEDYHPTSSLSWIVIWNDNIIVLMYRHEVAWSQSLKQPDELLKRGDVFQVWAGGNKIYNSFLPINMLLLFSVPFVGQHLGWKSLGCSVLSFRPLGYYRVAQFEHPQDKWLSRRHSCSSAVIPKMSCGSNRAQLVQWPCTGSKLLCCSPWAYRTLLPSERWTYRFLS